MSKSSARILERRDGDIHYNIAVFKQEQTVNVSFSVKSVHVFNVKVSCFNSVFYLGVVVLVLRRLLTSVEQLFVKNCPSLTESIFPKGQFFVAIIAKETT